MVPESPARTPTPVEANPGELPMRWLEPIPYPLLIAAALFMLGAPFAPEPHLIEKARLLMEGQLTRPIDIFDVVWHLLPAMLLGLKFALTRKRRDKPVP